MTACCTTACLRATSQPDRCRCGHCGGRLHGTALDESIYTDAIVDARRRGLHHLSDAEIVTGDYLQEMQ